jgi:peptidoglycan/xylan/chitin deacetylase (PgdA/CDA1 family)
MRKLFYLFLIAGLMWGMVIISMMRSSSTRVSASLASQSPAGVSVKNKVTPSIASHSPHAHTFPTSPTPTAPQISETRSYAHRAPLEIALTFDDGPSPVFTPQVLSILQHYKVHATFFCVGEWVHLYPGLVEQIFRADNAIGDHTWSHPDLTKLAAYAVRWQLSSASSAIQSAIGSPPTLFRPPYGATDAAVVNMASQLDLQQILWTIDTRDWARPGVNAIVDAVLSHATNGSIILMHDGGGDRSETVQALPLILSVLQQRGFTFVTVPQLLG